MVRTEEKRIGGKKRSKEADIGTVSDDGEPIGSLFKLKNKKNSRKGKLGLDGGTGKKVQVKTEGSVAAKEDDGSLEDTLASFRKKLKGPKKDKGVGTVMKKGVGFDESESLCGSEMVNDDGSAPKEMPKITDEGGHIHSDVNTNTKRQQNMKLDGRRVKKPKYDYLEATLRLKESNPDATLDKTHGVASKSKSHSVQAILCILLVTQ